MIKILIQIKDNKLLFSIRKRLNSEQKNLINTNIISENELVFSDEYIAQNMKLIHNFIKELIQNYNLDTLVIKELSIAPQAIHVTSNISSIKNLYILEESIINYKTVEKIIKSKNIKYVYLYNIPTYLLEMLDKNNIKVESRNEMLFLSNFMKNNNLELFSSLYYKTTIYLDFPLSKEDEEDFKSFLKINKYLKTIYINKVNKNDIEDILKLLYTERLKNITIYIEQNINDLELIEYLKKLNKINSKVNNIIFKIDYSKEYLEDNIMNQIHINTIKLCIIISLILVSSVVLFIFYSNYSSMQKVKDIQNDINNILAENKNITINTQPEKINPINEPETSNEQITTDEPKVAKKETLNSQSILSLKEMNEDTVGWLKVNNTNVDYPVVQAKDNDYYLTKNYKKKNDSSGWIFMDYRADAVNLSQNTIIFGHNMYYSGVMFGTLYKVQYSDWYKNKDNQIIEFENITGKKKWKIFSIYNIANTNDYLIADFSTAEKFQNFLDLITDRSIYKFNTPVSTNDKILTLSTCSKNGANRLVIHAVLLNEKSDD